MLSEIFSDKTALIGVTLIGMAMCAAGGIGQVAARSDWLNPLAIVGYILGAAILGIVGATLFGIKLPFIETERAALIAVVLIAIGKVALTQVYNWAR